MKLGRFAARTIIGGLFIGHGTQKLFGWFGGGGMEKTAAGFESLAIARDVGTPPPPGSRRPSAARCSSRDCSCRSPRRRSSAR